MDSGNSVLGQESTSRCGESDNVPSKWCQENPAIVTMSTYDSQEGERQPQVNAEHLTNPASVQYFSSLKGGSQNEATQQLAENQFTQKCPGSYIHRHSLSFPQHNLHQSRLLHSTKPHQSLEGHAYPYSHLPVSPEDLFFRMHGHSAAFSRKKFSALASYSQYSQKSIEQSEDTHKKEQKPKKPGKYICPYCTRACAKPSVLKKHIRSHTGERPYPCVPCGFSFKTKSNLYKHRKSHAHAIKAGLVPFTESAVSKFDLDTSCIDVEAEIHSDGEQSTDTDEETLLLVEESEKLSPISQLPLDVAVKSGEFLDPGFHTSEESLGGSVKVPILIFPKSGINLNESPHYITSELIHNPPFIGKSDEQHTARQKLALKLTEKKGQDSEKSSNLLSPHSKGSTDSGYFSRSESAEQNISPPNTNATSYEEIIFGKNCRLSPRSSLQSQEVSVPVVNTSIIEEHMPDYMSKNEILLDHSTIKTMKSRLTGTRISEMQKSHLILESTESESKLYPEIHQGQTLLLEAPSDLSPLIRSNSMPTSGASLSIPPSIRGSHSFDERMTGSDDVFYPGTTGIPQQRLLRRQGAFELPLVLEGHSEFDAYNRMPKNVLTAYSRKTVYEKAVSLKEKKKYEYSIPGIHPKRWDDYEAHKQGYRDIPYIGGMKPGGDYFNDATVPVTSRVGTMIENRKRRKEKSVGDEEDISVPSGSSMGSPVIIDVDTKLQSQEPVRVSFSISGQDYIYSGSQDIGRLHQQIGGSVSILDEFSSDTDKVVDIARKPPGNVISVIQHTNSLSRPNSFERSESTELLSSSQSVCSLSEACDGGNTISSMSPDSTQVSDVSESPGRPSLSQHPQQTSYHIPPKLVRQHNITVPEIRVTEEPDKPEKEPEMPVKEPEKPTEEFQWPQRSETLSQLPTEKLPPKKKRLRLADMENSSGESSFESTGTSLSRSPSQESNLSHSSSFSMSFDRDDIIKSNLPNKQDELGRPPELLTVPPGAYSLSVPGHHHQKEMRRSSSEQIPCPSLTEIPEIRSKSFDYGNLTHASGLGAITTTLSPARERKKCFLVRQASFSGFPETSQADQEQIGSLEQSDQVHGSRRSSKVAWQLSPSSSTNSDEAGNVAVGTSTQPTCTSSLYPQQCISSFDTLRSPLAPQSSYISKRHFPEQQHVLSHPEKMLYPPIHSAFQLPYPSVCMSQIQAPPPLLWPSCMDPLQRQFQQHLQNLQKTYFKPPSELQTSSYFDTVQEHPGGKPQGYLHSIEKSYQPYYEPSLFTSSSKKSKHISKLQRDHSGGSSDSSTDQQLSISPSPGPLLPLSGPVVPVRIQTHVPSYGSVMYTSISQIIVTHSQTNSSSIVICKVDGSTSQKIMETNSSMRGLGFNIAQMLAPCRELEQYPLWKVPQTLPLGIESTIPLCFVPASDTTSTFGGGKRMLSPSSSLELFMETKQQKRVKEERMYGQIVKELSAVELTNSGIKKDLSRTSKPQLVRQSHTTEKKDIISNAQTPPPSLPDSPLNISSSIEKGSPESKSSDTTEGRMSPDDFYNEDAESDMSLSPQRTPSETLEEEPLKNKSVTVGILMQTPESTGTKNLVSSILLKDGSEIQQILQFPSLRTTTTVSWCFLNYAKPSHAEQESLKSSVYASWCISSCNPNPLGLSTRTSLALLRSKQKHTLSIYSMAAMHRSGAGKLTSSRLWKLQFAQMKSEPSLLVSSKLEKKATGSSKERTKGENHAEKDISTKQAEPMRIKIFEGGFKSNEDYVYVRGRGRGKYICEECGIRCKKPSMLKKHIRTHTDVRPYVCKLCNFAFKTKGNLTKHMKSKAHMKKCLELGVAMTSVDDAETEESGSIEEMHRGTEKISISIDHQFSDAEETDGDDGDDNEDEDDEEDEFDDNQGDVTPKSRSRSTSPQPPRFSTLSVTASSASHRSSPEGALGHSPLMSYLSTMPSIQVTHLLTPSTIGEESHMIDYQRLYLTSRDHDRDKMDVPGSMDDDYMLTSEPSSSPRDFSSCSRHSSPGYDSSPCRDNSPKSYLSLRGDLSPRRHLSPRRDASPMRHLSPRKEAALRRELSPRRDVSPRRHLSPIRPMSPANDISAGRDLSPRRERRYMATFRALSPRRRLHHNPSLPMSHYMHSEPGLLGHGSLRKIRPQFPYVGPHAEDVHGHQSLGQDPDGHKDYVFSHLPLHSQQQIRALLPMIPVGGIQIINSNSAIQATSHPSITTPLHLRSSDEKTIYSESYIPLHLDKHSSDIPSGDPLPASSPTLLPSPGQSPSDESSMPTEREQEENIHTCTKAISCLRIAAEEGQPLKRDQLSRPPEPNQKTLESAQFGIRHFSGLEVNMPLACSSSTPVDLRKEKDNFSTSQSTQAHSKFYSKTMDLTKLGFHSRKEEPTSTQKVKDSSYESSNLE